MASLGIPITGVVGGVVTGGVVTGGVVIGGVVTGGVVTGGVVTGGVVTGGGLLAAGGAVVVMDAGVEGALLPAKPPVVGVPVGKPAVAGASLPQPPRSAATIKLVAIPDLMTDSSR
jgi:hypothetical protein